MGIVYILTNEGMQDDIIKIGMTDEESVEDRIRNLSRSSVPYPFECYYAIDVGDKAKEVESKVHAALDDYRISKGKYRREFFRRDPEYAKQYLSAFECMGGRDVTPRQEDIIEDVEDRRAVEQEKTRKENFTFSILGIKPGEVLTFKDHPEITCKVENDKMVRFREKVMYLAGATTEVRKELGLLDYRPQGIRYWCYEDRTLYQLRKDRGL